MLLPQEHTVMVRQTSKWGQIFLLSLVGLGATAFTTAWFYRIDEVITVQGRLVPQKGGVEVKSPVSGQLSEVLIGNGDRISKGDALLSYDVLAAKDQEVTLIRQLKLEEKRIEDQLRSNAQRKKHFNETSVSPNKFWNGFDLWKRPEPLANCRFCRKPIDLKPSGMS